MSSGPTPVDQLLRQYRAGELSTPELEAELDRNPDVSDRDALWARWTAQGLFDQPIEQTGWTRLRRSLTEEVQDDG